jgi:hypothetical protein
LVKKICFFSGRFVDKTGDFDSILPSFNIDQISTISGARQWGKNILFRENNGEKTAKNCYYSIKQALNQKDLLTVLLVLPVYFNR